MQINIQDKKGRRLGEIPLGNVVKMSGTESLYLVLSHDCTDSTIVYLLDLQSGNVRDNETDSIVKTEYKISGINLTEI